MGHSEAGQWAGQWAIQEGNELAMITNLWLVKRASCYVACIIKSLAAHTQV